MTIRIDHHISLEQVELKHSQGIFNLVLANKDYLREWLPWVDRMATVNFIENFISGSTQRNKDGAEHAFVITYNNTLAGRIGVYKIDQQNKIGEIGYWVDRHLQRKGIATGACKGLIDYCFATLGLNRIEIKCGTTNSKSQKVPEKLKFTNEGVIRQGEYVHNRFIDLKLYSMLKEEWG